MRSDLTVDISAFAGQVESALSLYSTSVKSELEAWTQKAAKLTARRIKAASPVKSGKYMKGWTAKKEDGVWTVFNRTRPWLTQLLEFGHPLVRNNVVYGGVDGIPHIKPAEEQLQKDVDSLVKSLQEVKS